MVAQLLYDFNKTRTAVGVGVRRNLCIAEEMITQHQAHHSEQRQLQNMKSGASIPKLEVREKVLFFNKPDTIKKKMQTREAIGWPRRYGESRHTTSIERENRQR